MRGLYISILWRTSLRQCKQLTGKEWLYLLYFVTRER